MMKNMRGVRNASAKTLIACSYKSSDQLENLVLKCLEHLPCRNHRVTIFVPIAATFYVSMCLPFQCRKFGIGTYRQFARPQSVAYECRDRQIVGQQSSQSSKRSNGLERDARACTKLSETKNNSTFGFSASGCQTYRY
jgi:hypothetical protein